MPKVQSLIPSQSLQLAWRAIVIEHAVLMKSRQIDMLAKGLARVIEPRLAICNASMDPCLLKPRSCFKPSEYGWGSFRR